MELFSYVGATIAGAVLVLLLAWPVWRIATKMGLPGPIGLLVFIPGVNILLAWVLALKEWPIERKLRRRSAKSQSSVETSTLIHPVHRMKRDQD